jgi:hypothetical protein
MASAPCVGEREGYKLQPIFSFSTQYCGCLLAMYRVPDPAFVEDGIFLNITPCTLVRKSESGEAA